MKKHTTTRIGKSGPMMGLIVLSLLLVVAAIGIAQRRGSAHTGSVNATDGDPAFVVSSPTTTPKPLALGLDLPALSDIQRHYLHEAQALPRLPIAFGVDRPPIPFTDNEATVFVALLYSESALNPYDEWGNHKVSEAGCEGIGQLCGDLDTPLTRDSDEENIYASAQEFRRLIDASGGDIMEATRSYKGVTSPDTKWQANTIFSVIRVGG